ncbi:MAG: glycosyltransferase family 4 protein [Bacteroidales bacterium]|nr:glycosyltransferase family 4 protein [Bacteroidales bacterium]
MKVLLSVDSLGSGGAQHQLAGLAVLLKERGYDVTVLTYFDMPFYKPLLDATGVRQEVVPGAEGSLMRIPRVGKSIGRYAPDVVIAYLETPSIIACVLKMMGAKWRLVVSERNTTQRNNWKERLRFNLFRMADFVVPNSYSQERFVRNHFPFLQKKVVTVSNYTDLEHFYLGHYSPDHPTVQIVVAASIFASKNTLGFIKAVAMLKERTQNFHIRWYGKVEAHRDYFNQCASLISELGLDGYVELLDKTQQIADKYRESDVFCLPSFYEGTPNVICEAMACGLPVVCSDVCDNAIYVKEHINGWLFNPTIPADMADKLYLAITSSADTKRAYSQRGRAMAEQHFAMEVFADKYVALLNRLDK